MNNHLCSVLTVHVRVLKGIFWSNNIVEIFLYSIMNSTTVGSMDPSSASDSCRRPGFDDNSEIRQSTEEKSISQPSECMYMLSCRFHYTYFRFYSLSAPLLLFLFLFVFVLVFFCVSVFLGVYICECVPDFNTYFQ